MGILAMPVRMLVLKLRGVLPGEGRRAVEVMEQGRLTHQRGPPTHSHTGLAQGAQVALQSPLCWPGREGLLAEILEMRYQGQSHD